MVRSPLHALKIFWQARKPLGWAQLTHRKVRLLVAMLGVAFANILIFNPTGPAGDAVLTASPWCPTTCQGDLFLVSAYAPNIDLGSFPRIFLYQADAVGRGSPPPARCTLPLATGLTRWIWIVPLPPPDVSPTHLLSCFPPRSKYWPSTPPDRCLNIPAVNQQLDRLTAPRCRTLRPPGPGKARPHSHPVSPAGGHFYPDE